MHICIIFCLHTLLIIDYGVSKINFNKVVLQELSYGIENIVFRMTLQYAYIKYIVYDLTICEIENNK